MTKLQSTSKGTVPRGVARRTYQGEVTGSSREETVCIDVKLSGCTNGAVTQLGECLPCKQDVGSSNLPSSTRVRCLTSES